MKRDKKASWSFFPSRPWVDWEDLWRFFMGNYETTVMRRKYKKSRVCAKQNGSVYGYNDASKNFDP